MHLLASIVLAASLQQAAALAPVEDKYLDTVKVSDTIFVFKPHIDWTHGNGVAIIGDDGVFFVDTFIQFNYAEEAIRRLRRVTALPVRYVLNTHWHYDHVLGNSVFKRVYPDAKIIAHEATAAAMERRVKPRVEGEADQIAGEIAQVGDEVRAGVTSGKTPIVGTMKPFWDLMLREAQEYQQQYRAERYAPVDITFGDTLTMPWGRQTLRLIHMADNGHSAGDVVVSIPESRTLITGDLVVGPTPYATYFNSPGMVRAIHALIEMNPAVVIPGHGEVQRDLSYLKLLEKAFADYRRAAEQAKAADVPLARAFETIAFPEIDRQFTHGDPLREWAYKSFFVRNLIYNTYNPPPPPPSADAADARALPIDAVDKLLLANVAGNVVTYRGRRALHLLPKPGAHAADWKAENHGIVLVPGSDFTNGVIEAEIAGAPKAGASDAARGFVGIAFHAAADAAHYEAFYLRPTNGRADDQLRRNHATQYMSWPTYLWDKLRQDAPGVYESYADLETGAWTTVRIVVSGATAQLFVNGAAQPALIVNDLKLGERGGQVGIWIGQDTEAHIARLSVIPHK